ncbi:PIN domain-containing protein [Chlorobium ferrooxidans]|uniref:PilT protein-like n=1 Tax=Chlorobium ferrooxidans DSM 13031 TaxID=377431 RepID=Q0YQE8_9CHLB|nr:type II toxin-antitoxin system VapC family toxin [Chlorobium ferrooxidans]EAT58562.1 PilT protein-like [Chlorobium ferrooxidans DSM 13031]
MKALDTNILVRFLVRDDKAQAATVYRLFKTAEEEKTEFFVSVPVLLELIWVLESVYEIKRADILDAFAELLLLPILVFDSHFAIRSFISDAQKNKVDLSDLLIAFDAAVSGCVQVLTFDKKAAKSSLFELLS